MSGQHQGLLQPLLADRVTCCHAICAAVVSRAPWLLSRSTNGDTAAFTARRGHGC
jgi:hypothetical protein